MSLDSLINITISANTATPSRPGFATIGVLASKVPATFPSNASRTYSALSDMTSDGFLVTDPAYKLVSKIFSQKVRPNFVKVWKRASAPTMTVTLKCLSAVEGVKYTFNVTPPDSATVTAISRTVPSSSSVGAEATAIAALIAAVSGFTASATGDTITVGTTVSGGLFDIDSWDTRLIDLENTTADTGSGGIAADLAAFQLADKDWYGLQIDSNSKAEIIAAADWVETNLKLFVPSSSDTACLDSSSTTDVMYAIKGSGYARTGVLYCGTRLLNYAGAGWMGGRFPFQPGSYTWAYKSIAGVTADTLTPTQQSAVEGDGINTFGKHGNTYTTVAGVDITLFGTSGSGEFLDITQFVDWLRAEMQVRIFGKLVNTPKIPYTDFGVDQVLAEVLAALKAGVLAGGLDPGDGDTIPSPTGSFPKVADISPIDRSARHLPNGTFSGRLAGAIHTLDINGVVTV